MAFFRSSVDVIRQIWFALDTANAIRHGVPVSEKAQRYCQAADTSSADSTDHGAQTPVAA